MAAPVAIIGAACRFPQAHGLDAYWELLSEGVDAITPIPADRFTAGFDSEVTRLTRRGGFLDGIDCFDAAFFGIAPRAAAGMDPQQRLLLETCWESLEDAGIVPSTLVGSATGIFVGDTSTDYRDLLVKAGNLDIHSGVGTSRAGLAGRVSHALDLRGPSIVVDTACCASLSALHLARQSILCGESRMAIAAGVNLVVSPYPGAGYSGASMLAADGRCKFGDAAADGFVRSDGVGVVVLKPLADALAAGDPVRAVILGSATSNHGRGGQYFTTPSEEGHRDVLTRAYAEAGIDPAEVDYLEAHGSGTSVGDPIEVNAAIKILGAGRTADRPLLVGSAKTNIGHCEAASGMAGLIKVILCLQHRAVPPSLHFGTPNPKIDWDAAPMRVCRELTPIPQRGVPMMAGVTALGITGTMAHVVIGEYAPPAHQGDRDDEADDRAPYLLAMSAKDPGGLAELAASYERELRGGTLGTHLPDICRSAGQRRTHHDNRLAVVGASTDEVAGALAEFLSDSLSGDVAVGHHLPEAPPRVAFVFPGQGGQWAGMGRELLATSPVFAARLRECDAAIGAEAGWSLIDRLSREDLSQATSAVIQPVLWAMEVSLAALWMSWGITPSVVIGHSMGEVAAACVAGMLTTQDAARVMCRRGALIDTLRGQGGMAVVGLPEQDALAEISRFDDRVAVAAVNGPNLAVLCGDRASLAAAGADLSCRGIRFHAIDVDYASHGPQVDPVLGELHRRLSGIRPRAGHTPLHSTVTGQLVDGRSLDASYWSRNLREKVRFADVIAGAAADNEIFLEIGPHPILLGGMRDCLRAAGGGLALSSLRRHEPERRAMLTAAGRLYAAGCQLRWAEVNGPATTFVRPPLYPWSHDRFWLGVPRAGETAGHPLLGPLPQVRPADGAEWEHDLDAAGSSYLTRHRVQGIPMAPGSVTIEAALAAGRQAWPDQALTIRDVRFHSPIILDQGTQRLRLTLRAADGTACSWELYSRTSGEADWTLRSSASLTAATPAARLTGAELGPIRQRCAEQVDGGDFHRAHAALGNACDDHFLGIRTIWRRDGEALAQVCAPSQVAAAMDEYHFHPALLDACFLALVAAMTPAQAANAALVLEGVDEVRVVSRPGPEVFSHAVVRDSPDAGSVRGDIRVHDAAGEPVAELLGVRVRWLASVSQPVLPERGLAPAAQPRAGDWAYQLKWRASTPPPRRPLAAGHWLLLADRTGVAAELAKKVREAGHAVTLVVPGPVYAPLGRECYQVRPDSATDFGQLLAQEAGAAGSPALAGVVHLWSLNQALVPPFTDHEIATAQDEGCRSVIRLIQALHATSQAAKPALWLVTRGGQAARDSDSVTPLQAPLWGLGRILAREHPELSSRLVDLGLPPGGALADADSLLQELTADDGESQVALRGTQRYVARLARAPHLAEPGTTAGTRAEAGAGSVPADAVGTPLPFLAALYALCEVGRLTAGERALIHCAPDGTGLAAVQIAQWKGAEVFATASTAEEQARLAGLGVRHVADARSPEHVAELAAACGAAGVDVIVNTAAGDHAGPSLGLLAPYGRYLQLARRNTAGHGPVSLGALAENRSVTVVDVEHLLTHRPDRAQALSRQVLHLLHEGVLRPLAPSASPGTGRDPVASRVRGDVSYLITGGLGDIGLLVAEWLAAHGARHLLLTGRSAAPPEGKLSRLAALRAAGTSARYEACDVADAACLRKVVADYESGEPAIAGVMHTAGVLRIEAISQAQDASLDEVLAPKVAGAWNLHRLLEGRALDFFVLFSSASSVLHSPLLGGYAAGNAFLDALAAFRSRSGQTALSIGWGSWDSIGMSAIEEAARGNRLAPHGVRRFCPQDGLDILGVLLAGTSDHAIVMPTDWQAWREAYPLAAKDALFAELLAESSTSDALSVAVLDAGLPEVRGPGQDATGGTSIEIPGGAELARHTQDAEGIQGAGDTVRRAIAQVLALPVDRVVPGRRLSSLGFDSLMAAEVSTILHRALGLEVPVMYMLGESTLQDVIAAVAGQRRKAGNGRLLV
jgi:epothilone polyketide synthase D